MAIHFWCTWWFFLIHQGHPSALKSFGLPQPCPNDAVERTHSRSSSSFRATRQGSSSQPGAKISFRCIFHLLKICFLFSPVGFKGKRFHYRKYVLYFFPGDETQIKVMVRNGPNVRLPSGFRPFFNFFEGRVPIPLNSTNQQGCQRMPFSSRGHRSSEGKP